MSLRVLYFGIVIVYDSMLRSLSEDLGNIGLFAREWIDSLVITEVIILRY